MVNLKQKQADSLRGLMENFVTYENMGLGKIMNVILMTNQLFLMTNKLTKFRI